jgi:radical SAM protein with 4Fe4S-binding SPASM domain
MIQDNKYNITLEEFKKIHNWLVDSGDKSIGLIGGEPTLNPEFRDILKFIGEENKLTPVLFTNGTTDLSSYLHLLQRAGFLINVNNPIYVGQKNYEATLKTMDLLYDNDFIFTIGITLFPNMASFDYIFELAKKYKHDGIRVSYAAPVIDIGKEEYYNLGKDLFLDFCKKGIENNISIFLECNKVPFCYYNEDEMEIIREATIVNDAMLFDYCRPVVDIDRKGDAIPCFGGKFVNKKVNIFDFKELAELQRYFYMNEMYDKMIHNGEGKCSTCDKFNKKICQGGCLGFSKLK